MEPLEKPVEIDLKKINEFIKDKYGFLSNRNVLLKVAYVMGYQDVDGLKKTLTGKKPLPTRPYALLLGACHMMGVVDFRELIVGMKQLECEWSSGSRPLITEPSCGRGLEKFCTYCQKKIKEAPE